MKIFYIKAGSVCLFIVHLFFIGFCAEAIAAGIGVGLNAALIAANLLGSALNVWTITK